MGYSKRKEGLKTAQKTILAGRGGGGGGGGGGSGDCCGGGEGPRRKGAAQLAMELRRSGASYKGFVISSVLTLNPALTTALFDSLKVCTCNMQHEKCNMQHATCTCTCTCMHICTYIRVHVHVALRLRTGPTDQLTNLRTYQRYAPTNVTHLPTLRTCQGAVA